MVEVEHLTLRYGTVSALEAVTLRVSAGELYVVAGADGAGKSTLLRVVSSLLRPTEGTVRLEGRKLDQEMRGRLGYLPQGFTMYEDLTVEENLRFFGELYEVERKRLRERLEELLAWSGLAPFRGRLAGQLSGGMKQKLSLAVLLLHDPTLLLLDEPTTGIDVPTRRDFWEYLVTLKSRGMTVVVATPYLEEARNADRVAFLHEGRIVTETTPAELLERLPGAVWELDAPDAAGRSLAPPARTDRAEPAEPGQIEAARERMRASGRFPVVTWRARRVRFMADAERGAVERALAELGIEGTLLEARASFEDAFLFLAREAKGGPGGVLPGSTG